MIQTERQLAPAMIATIRHGIEASTAGFSPLSPAAREAVEKLCRNQDSAELSLVEVIAALALALQNAEQERAEAFDFLAARLKSPYTLTRDTPPPDGNGRI
jgi:hypothetical protein